MKKKILIRSGIIVLSVALLATIVVLIVKNSNDGPRDSEKDQLKLSTQALDGVFNPFFYTSGYDGEMVGITQLSMLTVDKNSNLVAGKNEATVALDYTVTPIDNRIDTTNDKDYDNYYTTYEFVIKNNVKFSDGSPLTIKDVLFNMYVYLDPVYTGSTTMYSTNIKGYKAYRAQSQDVGEQENFEQHYLNKAGERLQLIRDWADGAAMTTEIQSDINLVKRLFLQELNSDWNVAESSISSFEETYQFTKAWQVFLFNYGYITIDPEADNSESPEALVWNGWDVKGPKYTKDQLIDIVYKDKVENPVETTRKKNIKEIVTYYATAATAKKEIAALLIADYFASLTDEERINNISGITTYKSTTFKGAKIDESGSEYDILKVVVNGVDPKAIYNFSFSVAPMYYYSTPEEISKWDGVKHFGVKIANRDWMSQLQTKQIPVGAGPYRATSKNDGPDNLQYGKFFDGENVYYERNNYFLLGAPKIKYIRYVTVSPNFLYEAVKTGTVDYADPSAKSEYIDDIQKNYKSKFGFATPKNLGYGYIGVNAKFVPSIEVRRAIMYAMNTELILQYYPNEMANVIYRPMSMESWAYPKGSTAYYPYVGDTEEGIKFIEDLVESAGFTKKNGIYQRTNPVTKKLEKLEYTFTLAGETNDHPAYNTFKQAADILEKAGFKITIKPNPQALKQLSIGGLQIWAAAWSSTIDPDMYQVYHKESNATSVNNWGYPWMLDNGTPEEVGIINRLSQLIEDGRATTVQDERKLIYKDALDEVMNLAVELPLYQRNNLFVYNKQVIDENTLQHGDDITAYNGPLSKIWEVNFVQR